MLEHRGVLIQKFENGKAMQVRLEPNRVQVRTRYVDAQKMKDTESDTDPWSLANGYKLAAWREGNSPVWQWLLEKGLDEQATVTDMLRAAQKK